MSFDDGVIFDLDLIGVKSRLKAVIFDRNIKWSDIESACGISHEQIERAFEGIEYGDAESMRIVSRVAAWIGVDPEWVLSGRGRNPLSGRGKLYRVAWEFIYRQGIPHAMGKQFEAWLRGRYPVLANTASSSELYRENPPQRVESVQSLYDQFKQEMSYR